ncbi:DUF4249 family protein [Wenyingzhuangia sp. IMCC45574]
MKKIFFALLIVSIYSCEKDVTNDITLSNSKPKLVINGGIERNTTSPVPTQKIELSSTIGFLDESLPNTVENAIVSISDGSETYIFNHSENGIYTNNTLVPNINTTYTITIKWNNETYIGKDEMQVAPSYDKVYSVYEKETLFTDAGYFVKFDSTDPKDIDNYYYYKVYKNDVFTIVPDPGNSVTLVEDDQFFDGKSRTGINPNEEVIFEIGDIAKVQLLGVSKEYFKYLVTLFEQTGSQGVSLVGNPPPASILSNLINIDNPKNRALGYFYTVDITEETLEIIE